MSLRKFSFLFLLISFPLSVAFAASSDCDSNGDTQFVCGPVSPEDLISIGDRHNCDR